MTTIYVNPSASTNGNGTASNPYNSWSQVRLQSGNTYLQKAGTSYSGTLTVTTSNVTLGSYGTGAAPQLGGLWFSGASNDTASNFSIHGNSNWGVIFANGATGDSVTNSSIWGNFVGVNFGSGTSGNTISSDNVYNSTYDGVAIGAGASGTVISNTIYNNGCHGVEITGNNSTVWYNDVYGNGTITPGSSGIHTYSTGPTANEGNNNSICWNVISGTHDGGSVDGNGIEIDQWTHGNAVNGNIISGCNGAGITDYDAYANTFIGNACFGDETGSAAVRGGNRSEMMFTESSPNDGYNYGNTAYANILDSTQSGAKDLYLDSSSAKNQSIGTNYLAGLAGNMTASQLSAEAASYYTWWNSHAIPSSLQAVGHAALEKMASF